MNKAELWSESVAGSVSWEGRSGLGSPVDLLCGLGQFNGPTSQFPLWQMGAGYHLSFPGAMTVN